MVMLGKFGELSRRDPSVISSVYVSRIMKPAGVSVWLVDGFAIRRDISQAFVYGGHGYVYDFIPKDEIWIDDRISLDERPLTILHEAYERRRMKDENMSYDQAHALANKEEHSFREGSGGSTYRRIQRAIETLIVD